VFGGQWVNSEEESRTKYLIRPEGLALKFDSSDSNLIVWIESVYVVFLEKKPNILCENVNCYRF
jgi:hypothetical protein